MTERRPTRPEATRDRPRWIVRTIWIGHRALYRVRPAGSDCEPQQIPMGAAPTRTIGRKTGQERTIVGYIEDGPSVVIRDEQLGRPRARVVAQPPGAANAALEMPDGPRQVPPERRSAKNELAYGSDS